MNILYLVTDHPHPHDYGADHLYLGLVALQGADQVWDWPPKPTLHLETRDRRDACQMDCDQAVPLRANAAEDVASLAQRADLVIIALHANEENAALLAQALPHVPPGTPVVAYDASDTVANLREWYTGVALRPLAVYAKREVPLGMADAWGALPLPLCYPHRAEHDTLPRKVPRVVYHAAEHTYKGRVGPPGVPRATIVQGLRTLLPASHLDVGLYSGQRERPLPEDYHAKLARALVGVSWNGAPNWDCNRFWESFAYGLCLIAERPRIELPFAPAHLQHCFYVDAPEQVATVAKMLLHNVGWALRLASQGHDWWKLHHTPTARAQRLLDAVAAA